MHMADALLSPAVGATMWGVSAGAIACGSARLRRKRDDRLAPLMGVLGGFLFAAQMINFSIPGTGSSGHLTGGLLLAILLGPAAAFLTIASVLVVQAFFFADGGLLALGCNIFNLGVIPAFLVYPFFYRRLIGTDPGRWRDGAVTLSSALIAMQLGALCVVLQTAASGVCALPAGRFLLLMLPIHLAIGVVEGVVTLAVVSFLQKARPELVAGRAPAAGTSRPVLAAFFACALVTAGGLSHFASEKPDGLEWSVAKASGQASRQVPGQGVAAALGMLQQKTSLFAGYRIAPAASTAVPSAAMPSTVGAPVTSGVPVAASAPVAADGSGGGAGFSGVVGTVVTLLLVVGAAMLLRRGNRGVAPEA